MGLRGDKSYASRTVVFVVWAVSLVVSDAHVFLGLCII